MSNRKYKEAYRLLGSILLICFSYDALFSSNIFCARSICEGHKSGGTFSLPNALKTMYLAQIL